jgi:hypothetical protein
MRRPTDMKSSSNYSKRILQKFYLAGRDWANKPQVNTKQSKEEFGSSESGPRLVLTFLVAY